MTSELDRPPFSLSLYSSYILTLTKIQEKCWSRMNNKKSRFLVANKFFCDNEYKQTYML
jgi:hypothetical protein